jgi:polyhydroxyalkanoate synthase
VSGAALEELSAETLEQRVHADATLRVRRERLRVGGRVGVVRKHAAGRTHPGTPVVLVHGFAQNRYTWHTSRRSFSAWLAGEGFDTWNMDLPGHGASRGSGSEDMDAYVQSVVDVVHAAERATGRAPFLIGHSLGGAVTYAAATRTRVRGVVGIGALFRFAAANPAIRALCHLTEAVRLGPLGALNVRTRLAGRLLARLYSLSDVAGYTLPVSGWAPGSFEEEVLAERLERGFDWTSANVWFEMARWGARGRFPHEDAWATTDVPLLVTAGDLDHLALPAEARLAHDLSGSGDRTWHAFDLETTGHRWGHLDLVLGRHAPAHVWPVLRDWMAAR